MAKRVSVINFKGGVGKTTLAFNIGAGLARYYKGKKVLLVDVDHQSSLSIVCMNASGWQSAVKKNLTINEVFTPFYSPNRQPVDKSIIAKSPLRSSIYTTLDIVPSRLELDDTEIELTASHQGNAIASEWNKRTLICKWIDENGIDAEYDYIIFDCPPATKIVSQNAIAASQGYIIPVVPEAVMARGAPHLVSMVKSQIDRRLKALAAMGKKYDCYVADTKLVGLVITRIVTHGPAASGYTDDHTTHLDSLQREWKTRLLKPYIVNGTGVSQAMDAGIPVYDRASTQNIGGRGIHRMYQQLTDAIKRRVDRL